MPTGALPTSLDLVDLDGDSDLDLVVANHSNARVSVTLNTVLSPVGIFTDGFEIGDISGWSATTP